LEEAQTQEPCGLIPRYVFDTGALIAAERGKERAARFLRLVAIGRAKLLFPLPVVAEWWGGRTDAREELLATGQVVGSVEAAKAAGVALARVGGSSRGLTIDAIVMATAALADAIVVTGDAPAFARLAPHFPGVVVLSV
jgi:predicted nucleic acid-binding protein